LVYTESGFDSTVTSHVGATGYCGIMPETFNIWSKRLNLKGKTNKNNVIISTELLRYLNDKFKRFGERKSWELTLASYNAGIGRVIAADYNIPEIRETQNYIRKILNEQW
jgi:soluble lytic murein transglycosylase-like protein